MSGVNEYVIVVSLRAVKAPAVDNPEAVRVLAHLSVNGTELVGMSTLACEEREPGLQEHHDGSNGEVTGFLDAVRSEVRDCLLFLLESSEGADP